MLVAFDNLLQIEITADDAAKCGSDAAFRYTCLHCGEEVFVAASDSIQRCSHFRHKHGNNDTECEEYIGSNYNSVKSYSVSSPRNRLNFYYNAKQFYYGIRFSREEIEKYQNENKKIELRSKDDILLQLQSISFQDFVPDDLTFFPITKYSDKYLLSIGEEKQSSYLLFRRVPLFFKLPNEELQGYVRLVKGSTIYTDTYYLVIAEGTNFSFSPFINSSNIIIRNNFEFLTLGKKFYACTIYIKEADHVVTSVFESWGYRLEKPERVVLLWPPSSICEEETIPLGENVYCSSSFEIKGMRNTNVKQESIKNIDEQVTQIKIDKEVRIVNKNAELFLRKKRTEFMVTDSIIENIHTKEYQLTGAFSARLFSRSGVKRLPVGALIRLTNNSYVIEYDNNIPINKYFNKTASFDLEKYCDEASIYYRHKVLLPLTFDINDYPSCIQKSISLENDILMINGAIMRYIEEKYHG